jgi:cytochrome c oxidase assembly factor 5
MRKRFRGNYPVGLAKETGKTNDGYQLYAGKPAYQPVKKINGDEVEMDPEKTRGL